VFLLFNMKSLTTETPIKLINIPNINTPAEKITINHIFSHDNNWENYFNEHKPEIRDVEIREVYKMLHCQDPDNGYLTYECLCCGETKTIHLNCNSRICTRCGKIYSDKWASDLAGRLFDVSHRHVVMTMPVIIRHFFKENRKLLKLLMDQAIKAIAKALSKRARRKVKPAFVVVLHTYGKALNWNVHLHLLVAEGGFYGNKWMRLKVFPYDVLRNKWKETVLAIIKKHVPDTEENHNLIELCMNKYEKGFYVNADPENRVTGKKKIAEYIGRYIRHPAIAESRITEYNGKSVTFYYDEKNKKGEVIKRHYVTMTVEKFIESVISHIPDNQFRTVRYYGGYWRIKKSRFKRIIGIETICRKNLSDFTEIPEKWAPTCPKCGSKMLLIDYKPKKPPPDYLFERTLLDWYGNLSNVGFVNELPQGHIVHSGCVGNDIMGNTNTTKIDGLCEIRKIHVVEDIVWGLEKQGDGGLARIGDIIKEAGKQSIDEKTLNKIMAELKNKGMIYEPRPGQYRTVC